MLESLLAKEVKVNVAIDDIELRSKLTTYKTIKFFGKIFFCTV